jgi:hypothetical protein
MRSLILLAVLVPGVAAAQSFDDIAAKATRVSRLDDVVWAFTGACERGDEIHKRQCRLVRDQRAKELGGATLLVEGDRAALDIAKWNPQRRSLAVALTACIRCEGIEVEGKKWFVVGSGAQPRFEGGKLRVAALHGSTRLFDDEAKATAWTSSLANARVQYVVRVPSQPVWTQAGKRGVSLEILGFRVIAPCHGEVVLAKPESQPVAADPKACGGKAGHVEPAPEGKPEKLPDELTGQMIKQAMQPVVAAANACFQRHKIRGRAKIALTISSDGVIVEQQLEGELAGTPMQGCIETALDKVTFPRTQKPRTKVRFPIVVQ